LQEFLTERVDLMEIDNVPTNPFHTESSTLSQKGKIRIGAVITAIHQAEAGCEVEDDRTLFIYGAQEDVMAAKQKIKDLIAVSHWSAFAVEEYKAIGLLGENASNLKKLQETSGARIHIDLAGVISVSGTKDQIQKSMALIKQEADSLLVHEIDLGNRSKLVSRELLKEKGKLIMEIQKKSGAIVKKEKGKSTVVIIGTKLGINKARAPIEKLIKKMGKSKFERELGS